MSFLAGLVEGFSERARAGRKEAWEQQEAQNERELKVISELTKADDPEIRNAAGSALLELAVGNRPKKGKNFLANLMGDPQVTVNPAVARLLDLARTPVSGGPGLNVTTGAQVSLGDNGSAGAVPAGASAAMPPNAASEPGGGPASPAALAPPTLPVHTGPISFTGGQTTPTAGPPPRPRQLFLSEEEKLRRNTIAREQAEVEGEYAGLIAAGLSETEAREELKRRKLGSAVPFQSVAGDFVGADGRTTPGFATFNKTTGQYLDGAGQVVSNFRPRTAQGGSAGSVDRNDIALTLYGKKFDQLLPAERQLVMNEEIRRKAQTASDTTRARGDANADVPLTTQQRFQATTDLRNEYLKLTANARVRREQLAIMETALNRFAEDPAGASESVRVTFEKILDAESVVREAEYARQTNGLSLGDKLSGMFQKWFKGGGEVPKEILDEYVETARQFVERTKSLADEDIQNIGARATAFKLDPSLIAPGLAQAPMTTPRTPAPVTTPAGSGAPNTTATPVVPGAPASTTLNAPAASPSQPFLVDRAKYPWWDADLDQGVRAVGPPQNGMPFTVIEWTPPGSTERHIIHKYADGRVEVIR